MNWLIKSVTRGALGCIIVSIMAIGPLASASILEIEGGWLPEKPEGMPDISVSHGFFTKYIWRGWNLGDEPVMQSDVTLSWYGFEFNFWTNYSLNNDKNRDEGRYQQFTEIDYTIGYSFNLGEASEYAGMEIPSIFEPLDISAGYTYYTFPDVDRKDKFFDSHEVYLGVSYDVLLSPSFTWYWDVGSGKGNSDGGSNGSYFEFGIGHTFDILDTGIAVIAEMTTGIVNEQWTDKTGMGDMVFSLAVDIPFLNYFTVTPSVAYSVILDRSTYNNESSNEFYGGIVFSFAY